MGQASPKSISTIYAYICLNHSTLVQDVQEKSRISGLAPGSRRCPILAMPVEPNNQPTEVDELRAELAEVEEIERNMVELLTLVQDEEREGNENPCEGKDGNDGNDDVDEEEQEELDEYPEILELADLPTFQPAPEGELIESQTTNPFESDRIAEEDLVSADALNALNAGDSRSEEFPLRLHEDEHDELEPSLRSETVSLTGSVGSVDEDWHRCFATLVCLQHTLKYMNNIEQLLRTASK